MQLELSLVRDRSREFFQICTDTKAELAEMDFVKKSALEAIDSK